MNETNHPARRLRHGDRPTEPLTFADAAANKAAEEGGLPELPQEIEVGGEGWDFEDFKSQKTFSVDHMHEYARQAIAADRASRQVANKAEVDLSDDEIFNFWLYRDCMPAIQAGDMKGQFVSAVRALLSTPPATTGASTAPRPTDDELWDATLRDRDAYQEWAAKLADAIAKHFGVDIGEHSNQNLPWAEALEAIENAETVGASTVLTDAQIMQAWASVDTGGNGPELVAFGRAVERLVVAAQAGQVAVPEGFTIVPLEPTDAMMDAPEVKVGGCYSCSPEQVGWHDCAEIYRLMVAAAPSPAKESK